MAEVESTSIVINRRQSGDNKQTVALYRGSLQNLYSIIDEVC